MLPQHAASLAAHTLAALDAWTSAVRSLDAWRLQMRAQHARQQADHLHTRAAARRRTATTPTATAIGTSSFVPVPRAPDAPQQQQQQHPASSRNAFAPGDLPAVLELTSYVTAVMDAWGEAEPLLAPLARHAAAAPLLRLRDAGGGLLHAMAARLGPWAVAQPPCLAAPAAGPLHGSSTGGTGPTAAAAVPPLPPGPAPAVGGGATAGLPPLGGEGRVTATPPSVHHRPPLVPARGLADDGMALVRRVLAESTTTDASTPAKPSGGGAHLTPVSGPATAAAAGAPHATPDHHAQAASQRPGLPQSPSLVPGGGLGSAASPAAAVGAAQGGPLPSPAGVGTLGGEREEQRVDSVAGRSGPEGHSSFGGLSSAVGSTRGPPWGAAVGAASTAASEHADSNTLGGVAVGGGSARLVATMDGASWVSSAPRPAATEDGEGDSLPPPPPLEQVSFSAGVVLMDADVLMAESGDEFAGDRQEEAEGTEEGEERRGGGMEAAVGRTATGTEGEGGDDGEEEEEGYGRGQCSWGEDDGEGEGAEPWLTRHEQQQQRPGGAGPVAEATLDSPSPGEEEQEDGGEDAAAVDAGAVDTPLVPEAPDTPAEQPAAAAMGAAREGGGAAPKWLRRLVSGASKGKGAAPQAADRNNGGPPQDAPGGDGDAPAPAAAEHKQRTMGLARPRGMALALFGGGGSKRQPPAALPPEAGLNGVPAAELAPPAGTLPAPAPRGLLWTQVRRTRATATTDEALPAAPPQPPPAPDSSSSAAAAELPPTATAALDSEPPPAAPAVPPLPLAGADPHPALATEPQAGSEDEPTTARLAQADDALPAVLSSPFAVVSFTHPGPAPGPPTVPPAPPNEAPDLAPAAGPPGMLARFKARSRQLASGAKATVAAALPHATSARAAPAAPAAAPPPAKAATPNRTGSFFFGRRRPSAAGATVAARRSVSAGVAGVPPHSQRQGSSGEEHDARSAPAPYAPPLAFPPHPSGPSHDLGLPPSPFLLLPEGSHASLPPAAAAQSPPPRRRHPAATSSSSGSSATHSPRPRTRSGSGGGGGNSGPISRDQAVLRASRSRSLAARAAALGLLPPSGAGAAAGALRKSSSLGGASLSRRSSNAGRTAAAAAAAAAAAHPTGGRNTAQRMLVRMRSLFSKPSAARAPPPAPEGAPPALLEGAPGPGRPVQARAASAAAALMVSVPPLSSGSGRSRRPSSSTPPSAGTLPTPGAALRPGVAEEPAARPGPASSSQPGSGEQAQGDGRSADPSAGASMASVHAGAATAAAAGQALPAEGTAATPERTAAAAAAADSPTGRSGGGDASSAPLGEPAGPSRSKGGVSSPAQWARKWKARLAGGGTAGGGGGGGPSRAVTSGLFSAYSVMVPPVTAGATGPTTVLPSCASAMPLHLPGGAAAAGLVAPGGGAMAAAAAGAPGGGGGEAGLAAARVTVTEAAKVLLLQSQQGVLSGLAEQVLDEVRGLALGSSLLLRLRATSELPSREVIGAATSARACSQLYQCIGGAGHPSARLTSLLCALLEEARRAGAHAQVLATMARQQGRAGELALRASKDAQRAGVTRHAPRRAPERDFSPREKSCLRRVRTCRSGALPAPAAGGRPRPPVQAVRRGAGRRAAGAAHGLPPVRAAAHLGPLLAAPLLHPAAAPSPHRRRAGSRPGQGRRHQRGGGPQPRRRSPRHPGFRRPAAAPPAAGRPQRHHQDGARDASGRGAGTGDAVRSNRHVGCAGSQRHGRAADADQGSAGLAGAGAAAAPGPRVPRARARPRRGGAPGGAARGARRRRRERRHVVFGRDGRHHARAGGAGAGVEWRWGSVGAVGGWGGAHGGAGGEQRVR